jgi:hypothetical protein
MAQITIDISDELAQQLAPFQSQLSALFTKLVAHPLLGQNSLEPTETNDTYREILDFLISQPTPQQIMAFKVSTAAQSRLQTLLQKNRELSLTAMEITELDFYEQLDTLMGFLKIRAQASLSQAH